MVRIPPQLTKTASASGRVDAEGEIPEALARDAAHGLAVLHVETLNVENLEALSHEEVGLHRIDLVQVRRRHDELPRFQAP